MKTVNIDVVKLKCIKLTEAKDDEVYFELEVSYKGKDNVIKERIPTDKKEVIKMRAEETNELGIDIFTGVIENGIKVAIKVKEQDLIGRISTLNIGDDYIGEAIVEVSKDGLLTCISGDHSELIHSENNHFTFKMVGSKAEYEATIYAALM